MDDRADGVSLHREATVRQCESAVCQTSCANVHSNACPPIEVTDAPDRHDSSSVWHRLAEENPPDTHLWLPTMYRFVPAHERGGDSSAKSVLPGRGARGWGGRAEIGQDRAEVAPEALITV